MSAGRALTGLVHTTKRIFFCKATSTKRVTSIRLLTLSSRPSAKSTDDTAVKEEPIKFSTSKASHKTWKVDRSLGSQYERPWWKVLPVSLLCISVILWCALREETDVDRNLHENIFEPSEEEQE
uniref:Ubiquinol-cytochrome c reductase complex assembly factor 4 n=1 Tax=Tetraodon nigroviridis TaxID=99883 RepID=H3BZ24_TETNG